ncbi:MAG: ATP-binding protein [Bdellovibrionaceae bacterium]|nr:ATP-binding protein [Pseudobdellovibrionaceae bacterium]
MIIHLMDYTQRQLDLSKDLKTKSVLLLGPRRTGKSQLIHHSLTADFNYNLLEADTFRELSANPEKIRQRIGPKTKLVIIDEVQKLPVLLDEVHALIENTNTRFVLTGSSARKLKRNYTSLMAGRARVRNLFPFTARELDKKWNLEKIINYGSLPPVYLSDDPMDELKDYVGLYLKEEIMMEALVRKIENFSRFLNFAALSNGQILNFESVGSDSQVPARTIREYYSILSDTLLGYMIEPIRSTSKRKSTSTGKFYFFDIGVTNSLTGRKNIAPKTKEFGDNFEHFILLEMMAYKNYLRKDDSLGFWNSPQEGEIDFVINNEIAIEVKATSNVGPAHLSGFAKFEKNEKAKRKILVCQEKHPRKINEIEIIPVKDFLEILWDGDIF